jgi:hypothetical protein
MLTSRESASSSGTGNLAPVCQLVDLFTSTFDRVDPCYIKGIISLRISGIKTLSLTPHAKASAFRASRQITRDPIIRLLEPRTGIIYGNNGKVLGLDLVDIRLVRDGDTCALDVCGSRCCPFIDRVHCASAVCWVGGAGFAGVDCGVSLGN